MRNNSDKTILAILFTGVLIGALDIAIVGPAIPSIETTLNVEPRVLGWIFSIYVLFNLVGVSFFARLSDIFGRRNIYIVSLLLFGLGSIVVSFSGDYTTLLLGRAIQGFGASGIFPVASAVVGDIFPKEKRGRILGLIGAVFGLAFLIGPIIAGILLKYFEWTSLFLINIPIVIILIVASFKYLPQTKVQASGLFDWKGILTLGLLLASFTYGINNLESENFFQSLLSLRVLPFLTASLVFLVVTFFIERSADNPVIKLVLFKKQAVCSGRNDCNSDWNIAVIFCFYPKFCGGSI